MCPLIFKDLHGQVPSQMMRIISQRYGKHSNGLQRGGLPEFSLESQLDDL